MAPAARVVRNPNESRFEIEGANDLAILNYRERGDHITLVHTEVDPRFEGNGYGSLLVRAALDYARTTGLRVIPSCPFVLDFIERHPEYADVLTRR